MKTMTALVLTLVTCGLTATAHADQDKDKNGKEVRSHDCLFASQPDGWRVLDRQHLVLWGPSQKYAYLVTLFAPIQELNFADTLAFIDGDHDGMICGNSGDKVAVPDRQVPAFPTAITSMRKVSQAELVTIGEQYNVKLFSDKKTQEIKEHDKQAHDVQPLAKRD